MRFSFVCICAPKGDLEQQAGLLASERQRSEELQEEVEELAGSRAKLKAKLAEYTDQFQRQQEDISILRLALDDKRANTSDKEAQYEDVIQVSRLRSHLPPPPPGRRSQNNCNTYVSSFYLQIGAVCRL